MKRPKAKRPTHTVRPWTYEQAISALPYVRSLVRAAREHRLHAQGHDLRAERLASRPGRPDRNALIAREDAREEARKENVRFEEALEELVAIDVYCVDPLGGVAFIPFVREDQLAWFVFDLFGRDALSGWRYHDDPVETRRPISEVNGQEPTSTLVV
jgi:hypothetical protein